jgi:hypothetical protein
MSLETPEKPGVVRSLAMSFSALEYSRSGLVLVSW